MKKKVLNIVCIVILAVASVVAVFFAVTAVRFLWARPLTIRSISMEPTLKNGSLHYADATAKPKVGDMVVFFYSESGLGEDLPSPAYYGANAFLRCMPIWGSSIPADYGEGYMLLVKRMVATGGDTVELRKVVENEVEFVYLYRNGVRVEEDIVMFDKDAVNQATRDYAETLDQSKVAAVKPTEPYTVPEGAVYVLGDNRDNSADSRDFGAVDEAMVVAVVHK